MSKDLWLENSQIRLNEDGSVDEIVIRDANNNCLFHLEQMSDQHYWMAVYPKDEKLEAAHLVISASGSTIHGVLDVEGDAFVKPCAIHTEGWWCSREPGHEGPCAARPTESTYRDMEVCQSTSLTQP